MPRVSRPKKSDYTASEWVDTFWKPKHPLEWGWRELLFLKSLPGSNTRLLAHAMGIHSPQIIKDVLSGAGFKDGTV